MKVYTLLKKITDQCKRIIVIGWEGTILYDGPVNNIPWHIAKNTYEERWEDNGIIFITFS